MSNRFLKGGRSAVTLTAFTLFGLTAWFGFVTVTAQSVSPLQTVVTTPIAPMEIGMNLGMMNYWSQEFAFTDIVSSAGLKVIRDGRWESITNQITLDRRGRPVDVPKGTILAMSVRTGGGNRGPGGTFECVISPGWAVQTMGAKATGSGTRFQVEIAPPPQKDGLNFKISAVTDRASLTQFSCRPEKVAQDQIFNPQFLSDNRPFAVLRFMDWMKANNQPPQTWGERATPDSLLQTTPRGMAIEYMVALANTLDSDAWFTLPLDAPDDYYRQFAEYVHDHLKPGHRAYVEVSNEVWNRSFEQSRKASEEGAARYPEASPVDANDFYYADRVRAVMGIWSDVYKGEARRIVRVLSTQAGSKNRSVSALMHLDTARSVDALAIAPYFGPANGKFEGVPDVTEYILSHSKDYIDKAIQNGRDSKGVADRFHLRMITYEGGPAYNSFRPQLAAAFAKADRDPRMYAIYTQFLERWHDEVGGLFMPYDSIGAHFGHMQYTGQPLGDAPKMRALTDFIKRKHLNGGR